MKKTVVVIDDNLDMREGLFSWLSRGYFVHLFASAEEFLEERHAMENCQCLLLDLKMPGMSGAELQDELSIRGFSAPIVFMSGDAHQADIITAWRAGAFDFLLKPFSPNDISHTLEKVFAALDQTIRSHKFSTLPITRREAQVLLLLGKGFQQQQTADQLGLSLRTVKMYRMFLKNKLNLNTMLDIGKFYDRYRNIIEKHAE